MTVNEAARKICTNQATTDLTPLQIVHILECMSDIALMDPKGFSECWAQLTKEALQRNSEKFRNKKRGPVP